jgi:hypothetical protein
LVEYQYQLLTGFALDSFPLTPVTARKYSAPVFRLPLPSAWRFTARRMMRGAYEFFKRKHSLECPLSFNFFNTTSKPLLFSALLYITPNHACHEVYHSREIQVSKRVWLLSRVGLSPNKIRRAFLTSIQIRGPRRCFTHRSELTTEASFRALRRKAIRHSIHSSST